MQRPTIITGDINVCLNKEPRNLLTTVLNDLGFNQLVNDATHVRGGKIGEAPLHIACRIDEAKGEQCSK